MEGLWFGGAEANEVWLEKHLLALKCLRAAAKIDAEDPTLHGQIIKFKQAGKVPVHIFL